MSDLEFRNGVAPSCVVAGKSFNSIIDFFESRLPYISRGKWIERFNAGDVFDANQTPVNYNDYCPAGSKYYYYKFQDDEDIVADVFFEKLINKLNQKPKIIFEDDLILAVDKPHFMPVIPSGQFVQRSLLVWLRRYFNFPDLTPIHRIDRETAGIVLFSKNARYRNSYQALFRNQMVDKIYYAVSKFDSNILLPRIYKSRLEKDNEKFFLSKEVAGDFNSESFIELARILDNDKNIALYRICPKSGLRHQIRLHMLGLGIGILGDSFYPAVLNDVNCPAGDNFDLPLQLLAKEISFIDPIINKKRVFKSGLNLKLAEINM